jgi:hypothetical protein
MLASAYVALRALGCASGACAAERGHKFMAHLLTGDRNRTGWDKVEKMIYVQMNLPLAYPQMAPGRDLTAFELEEDEEMPSQPSEWAEAAADDSDDEERAAAAAAAEVRSQRRVATLAARAAAAEKGRPGAEQARKDGRRGIKRPAHFADFE